MLNQLNRTFGQTRWCLPRRRALLLSQAESAEISDHFRLALAQIVPIVEDLSGDFQKLRVSPCGRPNNLREDNLNCLVETGRTVGR